MSDNWGTMTACDLGRGIHYGEIDPVTLTEFFLDAIRGHAHREMIYARWTESRALAEAEAARARANSGTRRSLLDGVPISWKDLFDTAGIQTEAGSKLLEGRTPERDALVVENATGKGLVCLGKTHMSELAFSGLGINPVAATPPNVHDYDLAPGGSSSGAAASVAFGLAAAGIGSDTGGSVRIPAAWNDLVGLKTTSGMLSLEGVVPLCAKFDTVGPLCRSVGDAAQLMAAMANRPILDLRVPSLKGKSFVICDTIALTDCHPKVAEAFSSAVEKLTAAGARVVIEPFEMVAEAMDLAGALFTAEAYATWGREIEAQPDLMFDRIRERFRAGKDVSAVDYIRAWHDLDRLRAEFAKATAAYDAVLMPASPLLPPNVAKLLKDETFFVEQNLMALRNTRIGNLFNMCGLTLPTSTQSVGMMMLCPPNKEQRLLRLGRAAEIALDTQPAA